MMSEALDARRKKLGEDAGQPRLGDKRVGTVRDERKITEGLFAAHILFLEKASAINV